MKKSLLKENEKMVKQPGEKNDPLNPLHYRSGAIQPIEFITSQQMGYLEGNVVKYITRYKYKNKMEDLKKCLWYLEKLIQIYGEEEEK